MFLKRKRSNFEKSPLERNNFDNKPNKAVENIINRSLIKKKIIINTSGFGCDMEIKKNKNATKQGRKCWLSKRLEEIRTEDFIQRYN